MSLVFHLVEIWILGFAMIICKIASKLNMNHRKKHLLIVGDLVPSTSDSDLKDAFKKFGHLVRANVCKNLWTDSCTGYGVLVFNKQTTMEAVIRKLDNDDVKLGGQSISVVMDEPGLDKPEPMLSTGVYRRRSFGVGGRGFGEDCYKCGEPGHLAQECTCGEPGHLAQECRKKLSSSGRYGGRVDSVIPRSSGSGRYGSSGRGDRSRGVGGSRQGSTYTRHRPSPYDRRR